MKKTMSKSKISKTNRKAEETKSQAKKKGKPASKKPSAKEKDQPTDEPAGPTEATKPESPLSAATEPATTVQTPVASGNENNGVTPTSEEPSTAAAAAATSDSRMPAIGTVLQKRDRKGTLRCECEVVEGGVRYGGTVYRSLSSAAVAAAKDLGLAAKAMNGFTFWGVSKPARPAADPLGGLERAWAKYQARLEQVLERAKAGEHREPALTALERHTRILQNLQQEAVA